MANRNGFLVLSASEGESFVRLEGPVRDTVEEAVATRDLAMKNTALGAIMVQATSARKAPPARWFFIVAAVAGDGVVTAEDASEARARAVAMQSMRQQSAGPAPVPLAAIADGVLPFEGEQK